MRLCFSKGRVDKNQAKASTGKPISKKKTGGD
jgi:hypothetical protein